MTDDYRERLYKRYVDTHLNAVDLKQRLVLRESYFKNIIRSYFPKDTNAKILELGCGYGGLIYYASILGYSNIRGIDTSQQQVEAARQLGIANIERDDLLSSIRSVSDGSIDAVITIDVIEHLTKSELLELSDEIYRVLSEGGRWITHQPNAASPFFGRIRYGDLTHENAFTTESISQLMLYAGFVNVRSHEDTPFIHGFTSAIRYVIWIFLRSIMAFYMLVETGGRHEIFSQNFLSVGFKDDSYR